MWIAGGPAATGEPLGVWGAATGIWTAGAGLAATSVALTARHHQRSLSPVTIAAVAALAGGVAAATLGPALGAGVPARILLAQAWLTWCLAAAGLSSANSATTARLTGTIGDQSLVPPRQAVPLIEVFGRHRTLMALLVRRDLALKYRGSMVGVAWSLAHPLVMTATYTLAFTYIFQVRSEGFVFLLLIGILAWSFFAGSAGMATGAIVDSGSLVQSVYFPRLVLPAATVLFNFTQYLIALLVLLPAMYLLSGRAPGWPIVLLPVVLALLLLFTLGVACLTAALTAAYRDTRHLLDITLQVLFWGTPILYSAATFGGAAAMAITLSPLAPFIESARAVVYRGEWPDSRLVVLAIVYAISSLAVGLETFRRLDDRFAEGA